MNFFNVKTFRQTLAAGAISTVAFAAAFTADVVTGLAVPQSELGQAHAQQCPTLQPGRTKSIRQANIKKYEKVNEFFDAENINGAKGELAKIAAIPDLNEVEQAYLYNFRGNIAFSQDRNGEALNNFRKILAIKSGISPQFYNQIIYVVAQVYFSQENYKQALFYSNCWLRTTDDPPADAYILVGQAQYMLKRYDQALVNVQKGITLYEQLGEKPKEGWLNILAGIYREKKQYRKMVPVLKQLVQFYPRKPYIMTLGGIYNELGQQSKMTAIYQAAYDQGLIKNESELITLASLLMSEDYPFKASEVLRKGIEAGVVKKNMKNYRLYAQSLMMAQEFSAAIGPLEQAAKLSKDGKLYEQLGQSLVASYEFKAAERAFKNALSKGKLSSTGATLLNLGMSQFEQKKFESAKETFKKAKKYEKVTKSAGQWIKYVDAEVYRLKELEKPVVINTKPSVS